MSIICHQQANQTMLEFWQRIHQANLEVQITRWRKDFAAVGPDE